MDKLNVLLFAILLTSANIVYGQGENARGEIQQHYQYINAQYGADQLLVNGTNLENIFIYDIGSPFYKGDDYLDGYIVVRDKKFKVKLRYNVFTQEVVVLNESTDGTLAFIPPVEFVSEFGFNDKVFYSYYDNEQHTMYYDPIYNNRINCFLVWSKKRYDSHHNQHFKAYKYSDLYSDVYFEVNNTLVKYKNKGQFLKFFEKNQRKDIANYMKVHNVDLKKSAIPVLSEFFQYCESVSSAF